MSRVTEIRHIAYGVKDFAPERAFYAEKWGLQEVAAQPGMAWFKAQGDEEPFVVRLRQSDVSVLILIEANAGVTDSALGRALDIQRANMVPLLNRLEAAGLIVRAPIDGKSPELSVAKLPTRRKFRFASPLRCDACSPASNATVKLMSLALLGIA